MSDLDTTTTTRLLGLSPVALHTLRTTLERQHGLTTAAYLQEAGFAAGEEIFQAFTEWLKETHDVSPDELDADFMAEVISDFFVNTGWGSLVAGALSDGIMTFDSADWREAAPGADAQYPSCHLSSGMLADFFGRLAGETVAVMEVECRTRGDERCRFLVGSPEMLATVYERMSGGLSYLEASQQS